ncbi:hypothetical protein YASMINEVIRUS_1065 [Yasminevirus sp. GU-2018]|uniref:Uncharacterized protein n=1 Tax=Yasminevirus sp. GU-2018 TaxID=2420051 RepID=A0A5K0UAQ7_9VIRU|nr:hypothetical protein YASMINEVIRUS_1065 [Yasminevirus sp. GU-2018]
MQRTNDNHKRTLYINVDNIDLYYRLFKDDVDTNYDKYMQFIKQDPNVYKDYLKLCDVVCDVRYSSHNVDISDKKTLTNKIVSGEDTTMKGGNLLTAGIVVGSFVVSGVVATMLWYYLNPPEECKPSYPLYPRNKIPDVGGILENILPGSWIKEGIDAGKSVNETITEISEYLDLLTSIFSVFDESAGSTVTQVLKSTTKIALSVGAAVVTAGMGGDKIVNVPFFVTKAINMTTKTFNKLFKTCTKITKNLQRVSDTFRKIQARIDQAVTTAEVLEKNRALMVQSLKSNKNQLAFIYDLFNVDFKGGPFHTECWVNFIMNYYIQSNERVKEIYMLLCVMNDIYLDINESVIGFVGSTLDMVIPESMGIAGTIAPLLKDYSYVLYNNVRDQITDNYNEIPREYKALIQNPEEMSTFIFNKFSSYTLGASDLIIPDIVKDHMKKGIDLLANGLHKGMSMVYMFLNIFIIFSELNAGVNKALVTKNLDAEVLLKECAECGSFEIKGLDKSGQINPEDLANCTKCKKFFIEDESADLDDEVVYNKCMTYKDKRDQIKKGYQKIKGVALDTYKKLNKGVSLEQQARNALQTQKGKKVISKTVTDVQAISKMSQKQRVSKTTDQDGGSIIDQDIEGIDDQYGGSIDKSHESTQTTVFYRTTTLQEMQRIYHRDQKSLPTKIVHLDTDTMTNNTDILKYVQNILDNYDNRRVFVDF